MLKNYFKTAFRSLLKNKTYTVINISGLTLGLTAAILLLLWVWDELSFDRMHSKGDRIFQVSTLFDPQSDDLYAAAPPPLALFGKAEIPAIENACRLANAGNTLILAEGDQKFKENGHYVDSSFFQLFDFPLLSGNREQPFPDQYSVILSQKLAKKYFGDENPQGKTLTLVLDPLLKESRQLFHVSGVMKDIPTNSSIQADFLLPFQLQHVLRKGNTLDTEWSHFSFSIFFLLKQGAEIKRVEKQLADLQRKHNPQDELFRKMVYFLQPIERLHLYSAKGEDQGARQVYLFVLVAGIMLLIACINYVNLVTALASKKIREVGLRKIIGANRFHLFLQFIIEACITFLTALLLAVILIKFTIPLYNHLSDKTLTFQLTAYPTYWVFLGTFILVLCLAGIYPAVTLASFKPLRALKGLFLGKATQGGFRKALVVFQFTCSVILIIVTEIISNQLQYVRTKSMGYHQENVFLFPQMNMLHHFDAIRSELLQEPAVLGVTSASADISNADQGTADINWPGKPAHMSQFMIYQMAVDHHFLDVMGMQLAAGKAFAGTPADTSYLLLNETAVKQMGLQDPIGKTVEFRHQPRTIAGIVKDFHFQDMKKTIQPFAFFYGGGYALGGMYVKAAKQRTPQAIAAVEKLWKQYNPEYEFRYAFLDDAFNTLYQSDIRSGQLFNLFAGIAILLSCLGLFGLVTFTTEIKVKEIGIRKTLGASIRHIILSISKDFLKLVVISFLIAFPLGWWMMSRWLDHYAYRIPLSWWFFALAGLTAFAIAAITVCGKAWKAALENPVNNLRNE